MLYQVKLNRKCNLKKIFFLPIISYKLLYPSFQSLQLFIQIRMIEEIGVSVETRRSWENFESFRNSWPLAKNKYVCPSGRYCRWQGKEKWYYDIPPPPPSDSLAIFPLLNHRPLSLHHHPPRIINSFQRGFFNNS